MRSARPPARLGLEQLEARRTPATLGADGRTVTFTDADGDAATVTFSRPVLTAANADVVLRFDTGSVDGLNAVRQQLQELRLTGLPAGLSLTVTAAPGGPGDQEVHVGWIRADGLDEGNIVIGGDLGRITAGDSNIKTAGLRRLAVASLGAQGLATQAAGGFLTSAVSGPIGGLTVTGDVAGASVTVTGGAGGKIGTVMIGGSLRGDPTLPDTGRLAVDGAIGRLTVTGDVVGGAGPGSGAVRAGSLGAVSVGGSLLGGGGDDSGAITSGLGIQTLTVGAALAGGGGSGSGSVTAADGNIGPVSAGSLAGGAGAHSGVIAALANGPRKGGRIASVRVAGDVAGGTGSYSASVYGADRVGIVVVGALRGDGPLAGTIGAGAGGLVSVTVKGNVEGGAGNGSGSVFSGGPIRSVSVGGSILGNGGLGSGAITATGGNLGTVHIVGDLTGGSGNYSAQIRSIQQPAPFGPRVFGGAIASVRIEGSVTGGAGLGSASVVADRSIGRVTVGKDWIGASIAAGVDPGPDGYFGNADDSRHNATISAITVGGMVHSTAAAGDQFAFIATHVTALTMNGIRTALKAGPGNDSVPLDTATGDAGLIELPPV